MAPVTIKGRRIAASNSKWNVYFDHVSDGRGNEVPDFLTIEAIGARPDKLTGICILPVLDGKFVLLKTHRHALNTENWEVPRGFIDADETAAGAALRELTEETGLTCPPEALIALGHYAPEPSTMAARGALFAATRCEGVLRHATDEIGLGAPHLIEADDMARLAADGSIEDAGTLIAYYRLGAHVARFGVD